MSILKFVADLAVEDVDEERLDTIWESHNLKNKSIHIDTFTKALKRKIRDTPSNKISKDDIPLLYEKYTSIIIKNFIPPTQPLVEEESNGKETFLVNPATSIIFEKDNDTYVATGVYSMGRVYPLQTKHLNICVTNGWYFKTDNPDITSPFKKV